MIDTRNRPMSDLPAVAVFALACATEVVYVHPDPIVWLTVMVMCWALLLLCCDRLDAALEALT